MLTHCTNKNIDEAYRILKTLWDKGYSAHDIITNIFRVCKTHPMTEYLKLEYIKVSNNQLIVLWVLYQNHSDGIRTLHQFK